MSTDVTFKLRFWRQHFLTPKLDPQKYGWEHNHQGILFPQTIPSGTLSAPQNILQLIRCNCKTSACFTAACRCLKLGCTIFCHCEGKEACKNPLTRNQLKQDSEKYADESGEDGIIWDYILMLAKYHISRRVDELRIGKSNKMISSYLVTGFLILKQVIIESSQLH